MLLVAIRCISDQHQGILVLAATLLCGAILTMLASGARVQKWSHGSLLEVALTIGKLLQLGWATIASLRIEALIWIVVLKHLVFIDMLVTEVAQRLRFSWYLVARTTIVVIPLSEHMLHLDIQS